MVNVTFLIRYRIQSYTHTKIITMRIFKTIAKAIKQVTFTYLGGVNLSPKLKKNGEVS